MIIIGCIWMDASLEDMLCNIEQMMHQGKLKKALQEVEKLEQSGLLEPAHRTNFWQIFWRRKSTKYPLGNDLESSPRLWSLTLKSTILGELGRSQEAKQVRKTAESIQKSDESSKIPPPDWNGNNVTTLGIEKGDVGLSEIWTRNLRIPLTEYIEFKLSR